MRGGFEYALIGITVLLAFFCFLIGMDKMIKLIIGTTLLIVIVIGWSALLETFAFQLIKLWETWSFLGIAQKTLLSIVQNIDTTTSVLFFVGLMIIMINYTHLDIIFDSFFLSSQAQQILLVPAAIVSIIIGLAVAVVGVDVVDPEKLQTLASLLTSNIKAQMMIMYLPLWILLQGCVSLFLVSSIGLAFGRSSGE